MIEPSLHTPLLAAGSPLDARSRALIEELYRREHDLVQSLGSDAPLDVKRRRRVELTLPELQAQPAMVRLTLEREHDRIAAAARDFAATAFERIYLVGCGDSLAAMVAVRGWYEHLLGVPCEPVQALELAYYSCRPLGPKTLVVTLSSSGATTRTVEAMLVAKARGARTLALTNTPGSALMVHSDAGLLVHAERKGWPTQATTAAMAVLYWLALEMARARRLIGADFAAREEALRSVPDLMTSTIAETDASMAAIARRESGRAIYLYAGGGPSFASAMIGAAKARECSPDHSLAIPLEEYHHYNSQKAGDPLFLVAPRGPSLPRARDTAAEGKRWGGSIYAVTTVGDTTLSEQADALVLVPDLLEDLGPLVTVIPLQLFAWHVAMEKFRRAEADAR